MRSCKNFVLGRTLFSDNNHCEHDVSGGVNRQDVVQKCGNCRCAERLSFDLAVRFEFESGSTLDFLVPNTKPLEDFCVFRQQHLMKKIDHYRVQISRRVCGSI